MSVFGALILRDTRRAWSSGGAALPIAFFLLATILFPFAVGPDQALLARIGGGVIWAAALLAALLPVERLIAPDLESGMFDQLAVRGASMAAVAGAACAEVAGAAGAASAVFGWWAACSAALTVSAAAAVRGSARAVPVIRARAARRSVFMVIPQGWWQDNRKAFSLSNDGAGPT